MSGKRNLSALLALLMSLTLVGCAGGNSVSAPQATDYSQAAHWLSLPAPGVQPVDVFYFYPTAWTNTDTNPQICAIDEPSMLAQAPPAFARQATAFETVGNIYAPYYRQNNLSPVDRLNVIAGIPTLDAVAAFDYYIKHYNNGRPFILAGHSQGSNVLSNLLAGYMKDHPEVLKNMIAAYVIGFPVTATYLAQNPHLKFAEGPDDTGVIISYNTEAPGVPPGTNPVLSGMVGLVINPITWTRDETVATTAEGLGSFLPNPATQKYSQVPQYADAKIDKTNGVLICSTPDVEKLSPGNQMLAKGIYHNFDYPFYYYNIRANAQNRVNKYLSVSGTNATTTTTTTTTITNNFPVVVFSDVHFNPFYDPSLFPALVSADAGEWAGVFKTSSVTAPAAWGSDTNYPSLGLALSSIKQNLVSSPLVIYTGDILGHGIPQYFYTYTNGTTIPRDLADVAAMKAFTDKTVAFVMEQVRASVGNIPVMFAVGNSDSYSGYGPTSPDSSFSQDSTFLPDTAELFYTKFLNSTVDHQEFLETFNRGGYYSAEPPGMNLMVIGLNTIVFSPGVPGDNDSIVNTELSWLDAKLASAKAEGKTVWLLMHAPPGADIGTTAAHVDSDGHIDTATATMMWKPAYQASFLQVLSKYQGMISWMLAGHTHMDEYRIPSTSNVLEITPAISPFFGNNPAFKVFTFANGAFGPTDYKPTDYSAYNYDLATMPAAKQFNRYYAFSAAYSMPGLLGDSLAQLFPTLATDTAKQTLYRGYYYSGHNSPNSTADTHLNTITNTNWPVFWSGIGRMGQQELIDSVNSSPSPSSNPGPSSTAPLDADNLNLIFVVSPDLAYSAPGDINPDTANLTSQGLQRSLLMATYLKQQVLGNKNVTGIYTLAPMTHLQTANHYPDMAAIGYIEQFALLNQITLPVDATGSTYTANSYPFNAAYAPGSVPSGVFTPTPFTPGCQGLDFTDTASNNIALVTRIIDANVPGSYVFSNANVPGFYVFSAPWETVSALMANINEKQGYNLTLPTSYTGPNDVYAISITPSGSAGLVTYHSNLNPPSTYPVLPSPVATASGTQQTYFSYSRTGGVNGVVIPPGTNTNETIYLIRHAEAHPDPLSHFEDGNYVGAGQWRALALSDALRGKISPNMVYSIDPAQSFTLGNNSFSYVRPSLTVLPYTIANNLPYYLVASFPIGMEATDQGTAKTTSDFFFTGGTFSNQTVLVAWEHAHFPPLITALLQSYGGSDPDPVPPLSWPMSDYDTIWTVTLDAKGNLTVDNALCEGIDSEKLPATAPQF